MSKPDSPQRRHFLVACSAASTCAVAGWRLARAAAHARPAEESKHMVQDKSDMSFEQVFRFGF